MGRSYDQLRCEIVQLFANGRLGPSNRGSSGSLAINDLSGTEAQSGRSDRHRLDQVGSASSVSKTRSRREDRRDRIISGTALNRNRSRFVRRNRSTHRIVPRDGVKQPTRQETRRLPPRAARREGMGSGRAGPDRTWRGGRGWSG